MLPAIFSGTFAAIFRGGFVAVLRGGFVAVLFASAIAGCSEDPSSAADAGAIAAEAGVSNADAALSNDAGLMPADAGELPADAGLTPADAGRPDVGVVEYRGTCRGSADCNGLECVPIPDNAAGWHTCRGYPRMESKFCNPGEGGCCQTLDCTESTANPHCYHGPLFYCGGAKAMVNECVYDDCNTDADCTAHPHSVCVPSRAWAEPGNYCTPDGDCTYDQDCTSRNGGRCMPFFDPCGPRIEGFFCTYADSICRSDDDCSRIAGGYCQEGPDGQTSCEQFIPPT